MADMGEDNRGGIMIRRDILERHERIETMDLFNDALDTAYWLAAFLECDDEQKRKASKRAIDRIVERYNEFLRNG